MFNFPSLRLDVGRVWLDSPRFQCDKDLYPSAFLLPFSARLPMISFQGDEELFRLQVTSSYLLNEDAIS